MKGARGSAPDLPRRRADRVSAECTLKSVPARGSDAGRWKEFSASAPLHAPGCAGRAARYCQTGRDGCSSSRTWVRGPRSEILSNRLRRMSLFTHLGARAAQRDIVKPVETDVPLHAPSARAAQRDIVKPVETDVPLHAPGCAGLWPAFVDMRMESSG